ncbi:helix-turn-helix domain-containing protein [Paenibacillus rhizovicinus]|uniref:Helix-turn-helix domain-containing protein n=1 Tax=Paenibacillus rhizovicinus TaxID=2704463 RepID=A0A6C0P2R7_9BACL|nr:AraC family transcriptional regulator [Paenibacillus rhizovicinus]QHW32814.1 helix-turn-helix domain-containing protein [Paenibacillus rhizovicinus]
MPPQDLIVQIPPLPHFLTAGSDVFLPGSRHVERQMIGVFDLIVVSSGALFMGEAGEDIRIGAGQALVLRPDLHHYPTKPCEEATHFYWVHFQAHAPWTTHDEHATLPFSSQQRSTERLRPGDFGRQYDLRLPCFITLPDPQEVYADIEGLLALDARSDLTGSWKQQTVFHNLLFRLCGEAQQGRTDSAAIQLAERTASFLKANYRQTVTNELLRTELNYHPIYITRCMRAVFGRTPNEYVNEYRLEQAKLLLLTTDKPVADIAASVGFEDPAYFARRFAKGAAMSPSAYRKQFEVGGG